MKIETITCHNVYNFGASLQAYALATYLQSTGNFVEIIDYQPFYLRHYRLTGVQNPRFDRPLLRQAYQIAKFPARLYDRLTSKRKKAFDAFTEKYLPLTSNTYADFAALQLEPPDADMYIAGSDQIWNPLFPNGKDPAFFLNFVPEMKRKISYAASFAVESLSKTDITRIRPWLEKFDAIAVRESSAIRLLSEIGLTSVHVVDPVLLLPRHLWEAMAIIPPIKGYILVYDFDCNPTVREFAKNISHETGKKIVSLFHSDFADFVWDEIGPLEFLGAVINADVVISNSFHATVFSLIFQKDFYVVNRIEKINTRMKDLLQGIDLSDRIIGSLTKKFVPIDYTSVILSLKRQIDASKTYLSDQIQK